MTAIGITGSYGGLNAGDEAILTSMLASLRRQVPDASFTVFSRDLEHTRRHHRVDAVVPARELTRDEVTPHVERLDLLLLGGGGILYDGEARHYLREVRVAQELGVPTMAYAVGAGPLTFAEDRARIRDTLAGMAAVTVRDAGAKRTLEQADVTAAIEVTADPALLLAREPFPREWLAAEGVPPRRPLVGVSLREPGRAAPDLDVDGYHDALAHCADFVAGRFDCDVVFIPMEHCDVRLSHAVIARMLRAERAHVLVRPYRPGQLLGLMEHLEMVIAMRLHVLVFAAIAGTPEFALPYAPKVADFVASLGAPASLPVSRESVGALLAAVDRAWDLRAQTASRTAEAVGVLQDGSRRTIEIALGCLRARPARRLELAHGAL